MATPSFNDLMKQAQKAQEKIYQAQKELEQMIVVGIAGAGLVKVEMTGRHDVKKVIIDDELLEEDKSMIEDLIAAAVNDAVRKIEKETRSKTASVVAGIDLPGGLGGLGGKTE